MPETWTIEDRPAPAVAVTGGPRQHFFGYYDQQPFDPSGRLLLALECDAIHRLQQPQDVATLGRVDLHRGNEWTPLARTRAWNWQMGCTSLWLGPNGRRIIHNDRRDGTLVAVVRDADGREQRVLDRPIFTLAPDGRSALSLNFPRLWRVKPETGYCGAADRWADEPAPPADGIFRVDLETGVSGLIVSHADMARHQPLSTEPGALHFFTHTQFNADGSRFLFWYRCTHGALQGLYTAKADGTDLRRLAERNSHSVWVGRDKILAWAWGASGPHWYLLDDAGGPTELVGAGLLEFNAHASFSPDGRWLLLDRRAPQTSGGELLLCDLPARRCLRVARFAHDERMAGPLRCDLHPRWSRDGTRVCVDAVRDGLRQVVLLDVRDIVDSPAGPSSP